MLTVNIWGGGRVTPKQSIIFLIVLTILYITLIYHINNGSVTDSVIIALQLRTVNLSGFVFNSEYFVPLEVSGPQRSTQRQWM